MQSKRKDTYCAAHTQREKPRGKPVPNWTPDDRQATRRQSGGPVGQLQAERPRGPGVSVKDSKTYKQNENTIAGRALNVGITASRVSGAGKSKQKARIASNEAHWADYKSFLRY